MAETKNPSLEEINAAIAREHGVDPASLKNYKLPENESAPEPPMLSAAAQGLRPLALPFMQRTRDMADTARPVLPEPAEKVTAISSKPNTSCFAWTPRQMLQSFIDAIDKGEECPRGMVIVYVEPQGDKTDKVYSWRSQLDWTEEYTYLEVAQQNCIDHKRQ